LWVDSKNTPQWVIDYLLPGGRSSSSSYGGNSYGGQSGSSYGNQGGGGGGGDVYMPQQASSDKEAAWMDLCNNYRGWWDNRANVSDADDAAAAAFRLACLPACVMLCRCCSSKVCGACFSAVMSHAQLHTLVTHVWHSVLRTCSMCVVMQHT
jgi:hypothetical protein